MPVWNVLVGDTGGNVEHDDTALSVDVVTVTETTELLLTSGIPDIELDLSQVLFPISNPPIAALSSRSASWVCTYGGESERVDLNSQGGNVLLLELTGQMALDEGGL